MDRDKLQEIITDAFRSLTLCFGGIFLIHPIKDEVIWIMMKSIEEVYLDACRKAEKIDRLIDKGKAVKQDTDKKPHPAIEKLLHKLDSYQKGV